MHFSGGGAEILVAENYSRFFREGGEGEKLVYDSAFCFQQYADLE